MSIHTLVIGGTRGMGRELVRRMRDRGDTVSVVGRRSPPEADRTLSGVHYWTVDVANATSVELVLREIIQLNGQLSYLVFFQRYRGEGDKWTGEVETSLSATKNIIEQLKEQFVPDGDRAIVVVGSIAVDHVVSEQPVGYHVAKAGLRHMADYYAVTLGPRGVRVNCVSPCVSEKEENRQFYSNNDAIVNVYRKAIPLGRMGTSADTANVIEFLCSPNSGFVTGQQIVVDGGVSLVSQESLARKIAGV